MAPLLAGVLIFGLVYLISLSSTISQYVTSLPEKVGITVIKKSIKFVFTQLLQTYLKGQLEAFCNKIIEFLNKKFDQQIQIISTFSTKLARYLRVLASIINPKNDFTLIERKIRSMFEDKVQFKSSFAESFVTQGLPIKHFIKIGIMIMMCFAAFLFIFNNQKKAIKNKKSQANTGNQKSSNNSTILMQMLIITPILMQMLILAQILMQILIITPILILLIPILILLIIRIMLILIIPILILIMQITTVPIIRTQKMKQIRKMNQFNCILIKLNLKNQKLQNHLIKISLMMIN